MRHLTATLLATAFAAPIYAEPLEHAHSFVGHDGSKRVGLALSIHDGAVMVGVPEWGSPGPKHATLYDAATGEVLQTYTAPSASWFGDFGHNVVIGDRQVLVCGDSYGNGPNEDRPVFLYDRASGEMVTRIPNPHAEQGNRTGFGSECAFDGAQVLMGAERTQGDHKDEGIAYLFDGATGDLVHTFHPPTPMPNIAFGKDVALWGDYVAIAQRMITGEFGSPGAVHLYDRTSGDLVHTFTRPPASEGYFAASVDMDDGRIIVGSSFDSIAGDDTGLVFLFDLETKEELMRFAAPVGHDNTSFGGAVALSGDYALIGAMDVSEKGDDAGAAYLFNIRNGDLEQVLFDPTPDDQEVFGIAVDLGPDGAVVGSFRDSTKDYDAGAVHYFRPISGRLDGAGG